MRLSWNAVKRFKLTSFKRRQSVDSQPCLAANTIRIYYPESENCIERNFCFTEGETKTKDLHSYPLYIPQQFCYEQWNHRIWWTREGDV